MKAAKGSLAHWCIFYRLTVDLMKAQYKEPVILRLKVKQIHFCCSLRKLKSQDQASIIAGTEMRKLYFRPLSSAPS